MFLAFLAATTRAGAIRTLESLARIEEGAQGGRLPCPPGSLLTGFFPIPGVPRAATSTDVAPSRTDREDPFLQFLQATTRAVAGVDGPIDEECHQRFGVVYALAQLVWCGETEVAWISAGGERCDRNRGRLDQCRRGALRPPG